MSTPPRIAAIPTTYKGVKFRSKLEAAWAEWFDSKGIEWTYEQEGYQLPSGTWYLPDFWLPKAKTFVEVKGLIDASVQKPIELAKSVPIGVCVVLAEAPAGSKFRLLSERGDNTINVFYDKSNMPLCRSHWDTGRQQCNRPVKFRVTELGWEGTVCEKHLIQAVSASFLIRDGNTDKTVKINGIPISDCLHPIVLDVLKVYVKHYMMCDPDVSSRNRAHGLYLRDIAVRLFDQITSDGILKLGVKPLSL